MTGENYCGINKQMTASLSLLYAYHSFYNRDANVKFSLSYKRTKVEP